MEETKNFDLGRDQEQEEKSSIDFQLIYSTLILNWKWFVLSLIVCLGLGYLYIRHARPQYQATAKDWKAKAKELPKGSKEYNEANKQVSVCGELAGEPLAAIVLFGLGLRKFSMNASNIAHVKRMLSLFTLAETEEIAEKVVNMDTQADVEAFLKAEVAKREQKQTATAKN